MKSSKAFSEPSSKTALKPGNTVRLNKFIAEAGICSRRHADELILAGKVSVNSVVMTELGTMIDPAKDKVFCDGKALQKQAFIYLMINKPKGYTVTKEDEFKRPTVYNLLPKELRVCNYAGRLDKDTEGLLLLTNDGDMIQALSHPKMRVEKVYKADINQVLGRRQIEELRSGVVIEGKKTYPAGVFVKKSDDGRSTLKIVISEGRKRQVRLMIEAVGAKVISLKRLQYGPLKLGEMLAGEYRYLTRGEIKTLKMIKEKGLPQK